ncbi:hypothetical protein SRHO_G00053320 [Serrasalmus rhombeus]
MKAKWELQSGRRKWKRPLGPQTEGCNEGHPRMVAVSIASLCDEFEPLSEGRGRVDERSRWTLWWGGSAGVVNQAAVVTCSNAQLKGCLQNFITLTCCS